MVDITDYTAGKFQTYTGLEVDILNPTPGMIRLEDIAFGLANICRFGGQIHTHYSVAQHSFLVAELAPKALRLEALMHDATEAFLGDVIKPLKHILSPIYSQIENSWQMCINDAFSLDPMRLALIKPYDTEALRIENVYLRPQNHWQHCNMSLSVWEKFNSQFKSMTTEDIALIFYEAVNNEQATFY